MRVITLDSNKKVISVKDVGNQYILESNEIVTELGELGQIRQDDGSFMNDETPLPLQPPTIEERLTSVEETITALLGL